MSAAIGASEGDGDSRTAVLGSLCLLVFVVNFGRVAFAPLVDVYIDAFGLTEATAGAIATAAWLGSAVPRLPAGYLLTRWRRHRVVLATGAFLVAASLFMASARDVPTLKVGAFLVGVAGAVYFVAANPLVSELFPDRVGRVLGIHGTAAQLAAVAAPFAVGGLVAVAAWPTVFYALAAAATVATAVLYVAARRADMPTAGEADRHLLRAVRNQWRIVLTGVVVLGLAGFVWQGVFNFYVRYLTVGKGLSDGAANLLLTAVFAAGVPAFWYTGRLADRFPRVPLLLAVLGGFAVCLFALTVASGLLAVAAVTLALGYVVHSLFPTIDTYLLDTLPDGDRGSAYTAYSGSMMVIQANGSAAVGALAASGFRYAAIFRAFAAGLLGLLALLLVAYRLGLLPDSAR